MEQGTSVHQVAFERSTVPTAVVDSAGRVIDVNSAYLEMSGRTREDTIGASSIDFIRSDELPGVISGLDKLVRGARAVRQRRHHQQGDGSWIQIEATTSLMLDPAGGAESLVLVEILDHHVDPIEIDPDDELVTRQLYQPVGDAATIHDHEGRVAFASPGLASLIGRPINWMTGRRLTDPELKPVLADGTPAGLDDDPVVRAIRSGEEVAETLGVESGAGSRMWLSIVVGAVEREGLPARTSMRDITELVEAQQEASRLAAVVEEQLAYRANHDDLTGLTARRIVLGRVDEELDAGQPVSVVFVDLDGFKAINDEFGHLAGDEVLIAVAERLRGLAVPSVTVGRAGGDEFVAVTSVAADADQFAEAVQEAVGRPEGLVAHRSCTVGASVGVAHSKPGDDRSTLLTRADRAMYEVKRSARSASG